MATIDPRPLSPDRLATMLRAWSADLPASEAAVDLLVAHQIWLTRADFRTRLVDAVDDGWGPRGQVMPLAAIKWDDVETFLTTARTRASSSELNMLRLAASIAGTAAPISLMAMTASLDHTNAALVLDALAHRLHWHKHGFTHTVTGHIAAPTDRAQPWPAASATGS